MRRLAGEEKQCHHLSCTGDIAAATAASAFVYIEQNKNMQQNGGDWFYNTRMETDAITQAG